MSKTTKIVCGVIAVGFAYDAYMFAQLRKKLEKSREDFKSAAQLANLYGKMLRDRDIHPDSFELIIMRDIHSRL